MNAPGGFWRRYAAYSLDTTAIVVLAAPLLLPVLRNGWLALQAGMVPVQMRIWELFDASMAGAAPGDLLSLATLWSDDPQLQAGMATLTAVAARTSLLATLIVMAVAALWFIGFESSRWQATPGKRALGMQVTDLAGQRPQRWRIGLRFIGGVPSWLLLNLGHAMAAWNRDKRALHDFIAGTRVLLVDGAAAAMPVWARAWLSLHVAVCVGFVFYAMLGYLHTLAAIAAGG